MPGISFVDKMYARNTGYDEPYLVASTLFMNKTYARNRFFFDKMCAKNSYIDQRLICSVNQ